MGAECGTPRLKRQIHQRRGGRREMAFKMQSYWSIGLKTRYGHLQMHWEPQGMLIPSLWETLWKAQAEIFNKEKTVPRAFKYLADFLLKQCNLAERRTVEETTQRRFKDMLSKLKRGDIASKAGDWQQLTVVLVPVSTFEYKEHWVFWLISAGIKRSEENIPPAASSSEAAPRNNRVGLMNRLSSHSRITGEIFKSSALRQTVRLMKFLQCWKVSFWKLHSKCFTA